MDSPELLTTREAANVLGLAPQTLAKLRVVGGGPPYRKIRKLVRYEANELADWLRGCRRTSTSDPGSELSAAK